ncbi:YedE family putative selenium transporter [Levilinea saccharolytica]|uniref:Membrane protein n=1 Tax=Levilinea saccharolytica TaxID=229921 RepID=A0A0P6YCK5_9CHLR|nr:YedE family putative selenium transporter [Levilinea saccharolytica]KPL79747.1 membrane protein [Levilinea saccharolytica]GAP16761.1 putative selenium metabolism protein, YedE family [Levilinea saccharolytica]
MQSVSKFLTSRWGPILTGIVIGILAPLLVKFGNPGNMGICVACFSRDIAGALGFHRAATVQYIRPEIIGFVFGSLAAALLFREFKPRGGSSPLIRFLLGMFAIIGALVFLGCPWRAYLRLSGGDWNAIPGILGLFAGIGLGILFLKRGFSLGRSRAASPAAGWVMPAFALLLLILLVTAPLLGRDAEGNPVGPIFFSEKGPGSQHASLLLALGVGLVVGFLAQRSRFCTVGALRDVVLLRDGHLFYGVLALVLTAFVTNLALGQFNPGFEAQPVAHTNALWNFGGMVLAGLAFTLAGGCPGRQVFLSGEGDADATLFVFGMIAGAGVAHTFSLAASPAGPGANSAAAVIAGLVILTILGLTMREKASA